MDDSSTRFDTVAFTWRTFPNKPDCLRTSALDVDSALIGQLEQDQDTIAQGDGETGRCSSLAARG